MKKTKARGLLWGMFLADSLALGPHWIYDTQVIANHFGHIEQLQGPATSYHPGKVAGSQTHLGDQALILLQASREGYEAEKFMLAWTAFWGNNGTVSYRDHATKETLANIDSGKPMMEAGSTSGELAGPARGLLLVALLEGHPRSEVIESVVGQTRLTHHSKIALETAGLLATIVYQIGQGLALDLAIKNSFAEYPQFLPMLSEAEAQLPLDAVTAIDKLGQSCALPGALASTLYLTLKYQNDPVEGLIQNALVGGDSAARGLALGAMLGAIHGFEVWPQSWIEQLTAAPLLDTAI